MGRRKEGPLRRAHVEWEFVIFVRLMNQLWDPGDRNLKLGLSVSPLCVTAASSFCTYGGARVIAVVMEAAVRVVFVGILITSGRPDP